MKMTFSLIIRIGESIIIDELIRKIIKPIVKKHFCEIFFLENKTILHIFLQINRFSNTSQFVHFL